MLFGSANEITITANISLTTTMKATDKQIAPIIREIKIEHSS